MKLFTFAMMLTCFLSAGCSTVMNPYEEEFGCPGGDFGSCDDVTKAYEKSFQENDESFSPMVKVKINNDVLSNDNYYTPGVGDNERPINTSKEHSKHPRKKGEIYNHQKALLTELQGVISDEKTPMLLPAKQMRLLVLGYEDNHMTYYGHRYVYFIAEPHRWILPTNRIGIPFRKPETLFK